MSRIKLKFGEAITIHSGAYTGKKAWLNDGKKKGLGETAHIIVELKDADGESYVDTKRIYKDSFVLKKDMPQPSSRTECLIRDNPKVEKAMRKAARDVACLGIVTAKHAAHYFLGLVEEYIEKVCKNPQKANLIPIKVDSGLYLSLYADDSKVTDEEHQASLKRVFQDKDMMSA